MSSEKPYDIATKAAEFLQGTCAALEGALAEFDAQGMDDNSEFCARLDELVFCCECCGWWHEQSEMAQDVPGDPWICEECADEDRGE